MLWKRLTDSDCVIKNLDLTDVYFDGEDRAAGVAVHVDGSTIENVNVSGVIQSDGDRMGGIAGDIDGNATIKGCTVNVKFNKPSCDEALVGGVAGFIKSNGTVVVEDCINYSDIFSNTKGDGVTD